MTSLSIQDIYCEFPGEINRAQGFFSALRLSVAASPAVHTRSFAANHQELGKKKGTSGI